MEMYAVNIQEYKEMKALQKKIELEFENMTLEELCNFSDYYEESLVDLEDDDSEE